MRSSPFWSGGHEERAAGVDAAPPPHFVPIGASAPHSRAIRRPPRPAPRAKPPPSSRSRGAHAAQTGSTSSPFGLIQNATPARAPLQNGAARRPSNGRQVRRQHQQVRSHRNHGGGKIEDQEESQQPGGPQAFPLRPQVAREGEGDPAAEQRVERVLQPQRPARTARRTAGRRRARAAAYRTRCRGRVPCRASICAAAARGGCRPPTGCPTWHSRAASSSANSSGKNSRVWVKPFCKTGSRAAAFRPAGAPGRAGNPRRRPGRPARTPRSFRSSSGSCRYRSASLPG